MNDIIIITLLSIVLILLIYLMIKMNKSGSNNDYTTLLRLNQSLEQKIIDKNRGLEQQIRQEFSASRLESAQTQSNQRQELVQSMNDMSRKINQMSKENYDFNVKMASMIAGSLNEMRNSNDGKISEMITSNEKKLEQMRITVDEKLSSTLGQRLDSSFKSVSEQLENVYKSLGEMKVLSGGVTENVSSLNRILTNVKARGTWAEVQLENILNQTIAGMFEKNVMTNPKSREVVEFAVKIPSSEDSSKITYVPIDSKFPIEDYIRLCSSADEGDKMSVDKARKNLESTVILQARQVKKYINEPNTTPFAIMYLATEGLYSEIISSKNAIVERCQSEFNVMIAGPSTITALLNSLAMGFRAIAINEKAKEVRIILSAAKAQYEKFSDVLIKARRKIDEAGKSLDEAQSRNSIIQKKLKTVEVIEMDSANEILSIED